MYMYKLSTALNIKSTIFRSIKAFAPGKISCKIMPRKINRIQFHCVDHSFKVAGYSAVKPKRRSQNPRIGTLFFKSAFIVSYIKYCLL